MQFLEAILRIAIVKFIEPPKKPKKAKKDGGAKKHKGKKSKSAASEGGAGAEEELEVNLAEELDKQMVAMGRCKDAAEAIQWLLDLFIFPHVPPEAQVSLMGEASPRT